MTIKEVILYPEYDNAKSFYNKAKVKKYYDDNNILVKTELYSYNTLVLTIENDKYTLNYSIDKKLLFSQTTLRHIKEALKQNIKMLALSSLIDGNITKNDIIKYNNYQF